MKDPFITLDVIASKEQDGQNSHYNKTGLQFEVLINHIAYIRETADWEKQNYKEVKSVKAAVKLTTGETLIVLGNAADIAGEVQNQHNE
tara:strand:- start:3028 stop:3294 length:267 start_codon:yes stop_codon:yes gene_type:complete